MALLRRGYPRDYLRSEYYRLNDVLTRDGMERRFGKPPYWFLAQNVGSNYAPTYAQFHPVLVDEKQRQYLPVGPEEPMSCYVRLPKEITAQQRTFVGLLTTRPDMINDYPRINEQLVLRPVWLSPDAAEANGRTWVMRVAQLQDTAGSNGQGRRIATGRIVFSQRVPQLMFIETDAERQARDGRLRAELAVPERVTLPAATPPPRRGSKRPSPFGTGGTPRRSAPPSRD